MKRRSAAWVGLVTLATLLVAVALAGAEPSRESGAPADATATPIPAGDKHPFVFHAGVCQVDWWLPLDPWLHEVWVEKNGVRTALIPQLPSISQPLWFNLGDSASVRWFGGDADVHVVLKGIRYT